MNITRRELVAGAAGVAMAGRQDPVRVGFVGVGNRGSALLKAVLQVPGVEVAAVCDIDAEAREKAAGTVARAGSTRPELFDDWHKLLAKGDISTVVAALPCDLHFAMYRDALAAKKHLYGEKPLALSVAHADALVKQSATAGVVFQVGFQRRFSKQLGEGVRLVRDGVIGQPYDGRGGRFGTGGPYRNPGEWFSFRARSGDWMLEQAVHNWDALNWALGELPEAASGAGRQDLFKEWDPKRDVSDYYTALLTYRSGLSLAWMHTWASPPHERFTNSFEQLVGLKGGIDLSKGLVSYIPVKGGEKRVQQIDADPSSDTTLAALASFFDCVRTGRTPVVGPKEGREATLVGLLVRKAVYERRVVTMKEILSAT